MQTNRRSRGRPAVRLIVMTAVVSACGPGRPDGSPQSDADEPVAPEGLAGTTWQLVEFQSMSDEVGTLRPDGPSLYTVSFATDGTVSLRLDCNRGTGTWSATPSSATAGSLEFGPVATTRALCPAPSLSERIAADVEFVRSYIIRDDRLYLSLLADAGIYVWERIPYPA